MAKTDREIIALFVAFYLVVGLLGFIAERADGGTSAATTGGLAAGHNPQPDRICFSARTWNGNDQRRPCYVVAGPMEDGSGRIYLGSARRYVRYCVVPSLAELTRWHDASVECHRTARND